MRLRYLASALLLGLLLARITPAWAQPARPVPPVSAPAPIPAPAVNPFRASENLAVPTDQPDFSEATDQDLQGPVNRPPSSEATSNRSNNRRPTTAAPVSTSRNSTRRGNSSFSPRLARAAPIMGDSFAQPLQISIPSDPLDTLEHGLGVLLPQGGGGTRGKIAENSATLPLDRLIFNYNHFHNALSDFNGQSNVDRFTLGFEKTFREGMFSVDVRLPLLANHDLSTPSFDRNGSEVGNLFVSLKALLTSDNDSAIVAGMTLDLPTADDVSVVLNRDVDPFFFSASNDAVHLAPYVGFLCAPRGGNTHQGFLQIDVPTGGNDLQFSDANTGATTVNLLEQTLLYVDYSFSKLLYTSPGKRRSNRCEIQQLTGLAELHYTTALEDSEVVQIDTGLNDFNVSNFGNRIDVVNLTLGVQTLFFGGTQLRLGTVSPITNEGDRFFDFEFQAQINVPL